MELENKEEKIGEEQGVERIRQPKEREVVCYVEAILGGSRLRVVCSDKEQRIVRIPGRLKRRLRVREADFVIVEPWEYDNRKGDLVWVYKRNQVDRMKKTGLLKNLENYI